MAIDWSKLKKSSDIQDEAKAVQRREVRILRNRLLAATDYTQMPDYPGTDRDLWAVYRQQLRDHTNQQGWERVTLPGPPAPLPDESQHLVAQRIAAVRSRS